MEQLKHSHKFMIFSIIFKFLIHMIIPFIIFVVGMGSVDLKFSQKYGGDFAVGTGVIATVVVIILAIVKWSKNKYSLVDDVMTIEYGVFITHERIVPLSQMLSADISSSLIQRLFNVCRIEIDTARGEERSEIYFFLSKQEAVKIKNTIFRANENSVEVQIIEGTPIKKFECSLRDLFVSTTMSSRILAGVFIIIEGYFKIEDLVPKVFMKRAQVFGVDTIKGVNASSTIRYKIAIIFIIMFISGMVSVIANIIKYYKFTVIRQEDNIKLSYGLFDKKEVCIPVKQIQSTTIVEGFTKKPLWYFSLKVNTIGNGENGGGSIMICPNAKVGVLNKFFQDILPEMNISYDLIKSPRKALFGFLLVRVLIYSIVISLIAMYVPYGYYVFLLLPILVIWNYVSFNDNGIYWGDHFVIMRYRKLSRKTIIINKECIKSIDKEQSYFQKKKSICKYEVTITGDNFGKSYSVGYVNSRRT
ncbi:PH domain-containing protein [Clostridium sp.]|jgi:putative membrane protein|uniref:PH domain-containing protein n=1 Tax=Clostridium sp. TaxID=1506 RepID=UPI003EEFFDFB